MDRTINLFQSVGITVVFIVAGPSMVKAVAGGPAAVHQNVACATVPSSAVLPTEPVGTFYWAVPPENVMRATLLSRSDSQDPLSDLCEAIEEGCLKGCKRGAEILESWGMIEENDMDAYVERCMDRHCDSPCKPTAS